MEDCACAHSSSPPRVSLTLFFFSLSPANTQEADYHCLDTDPQVLARSPPSAHCILLPPPAPLAPRTTTAADPDPAAPVFTELVASAEDRERVLRKPERIMQAAARGPYHVAATLPSRSQPFGGVAFLLGAGGEYRMQATLIVVDIVSWVVVVS